MTLFKCPVCAREHETDIHCFISFCQGCGAEMIRISENKEVPVFNPIF